MIRQGRADGWFQTSPASLKALSGPVGVEFGPINITSVSGRGSALVASRAIKNNEKGAAPLLTVPRDFILSRETVLLHARSDRHLRQVLDAVGDWAASTRRTLLIFLIVQATHACPNVSEPVGVSTPLSEYVKSLPYENLPTFWQDEDLALIEGTSLSAAVAAKMSSLYREFEQLEAATSSIGWCRREWWDEVNGLLQFDDWRQADAMFRSRALDFPGVGECMIMCIDIANHASGTGAIARYDAGPEGCAQLVLREDRHVEADEEITITYGDDKGACEMLFSYGFLENEMQSAHTLVLDLEISDDDPLKRAKQHVAESAPSVQLREVDEGITWDSDYVWLMVVNEEDGLEFGLLQTVDGGRELQVSWAGEVLTGIAELPERMRSHRLWPVFELRATVRIQERIGRQLRLLLLNPSSEDANATVVGTEPKSLAKRLVGLEMELLRQAQERLATQVQQLAQHTVVQAYLAQERVGSAEESQGDAMEEEDYS